jgi:hypothetical protein
MIVGGDLVTRGNKMKILGLNTDTTVGKVVKIGRDSVTFAKNGAKVVLTFAEVEKMMNV